MQTIEEGYIYELESLSPSEGEPPLIRAPQRLTFVKKELVDGVFQTVLHGTTNEEVLEMLIARLQFLQGKLSSRETAIAITKIQEALMWLEKRTADRKARGVENTPEK